MQVLLAKGANIEVIDAENNNRNPLHIASQEGSLNVVHVLLASGMLNDQIVTQCSSICNNLSDPESC